MLITSGRRRRHISNDLDLVIKYTEIQQNLSYTYLGVTLGQDLTFNLQVDCTVNKASRALGALKRASNFIPQDTRPTMYNTLVLPHLDYTVPLAGPLRGTLRLSGSKRLKIEGCVYHLQMHS